MPTAAAFSLTKGVRVRQRRLIKLATPLVLGSLLLAACGDKKEDNTGSGDGDLKTVKIGLLVPLSGDLSALGLGMKNAVKLRIDQANADKEVDGWKIEYAPEDDQAKADVGASVANRFASDKAMVGVVGTLNSSVAEQVAPVLAAANIAMVSPANTGVALTGRDNLAAQKRKYATYFRVATTDDIQGPFAAQYMYNTAGKKKVVVIHDKKTYGQGLAAAFSAEFTKLGGTVLATETINPGEKDFSGTIDKIKAKSPEAVYYGGEFPEAAPLSKQMKGKGLKVLLMGGDGIYSGKFIEQGGAEVEGDLATSVGAPTESLASAKSFVDAYTAAKFAEPYEAYGAYAYDAATAIIDALEKVLEGKDEITDDIKKEINTAIGDITFEGVTGNVAFDDFGDTTNKVLTVYAVKSGKWVPEKTDEFK
jgi:branched-chain amino acid transport system substrate-binding protein